MHTEKIHTGWSEADITPPKRVALAGQLAERISEYIENKTEVKCDDIISGEELQNTINTHNTEAHIIKSGTIAIAANPYELFPDYGNSIKARSKAEQTFIIQLAIGGLSELALKP